MTMPAEISLRAYATRDAASVRALHALAFRRLAAGHHTQAQIAAHDALIAGVAYEEDLARSHLTLAEHPLAGLIGTAGWLIMEDRPHTARIRKVFIHPGWARRGLASALVRRAERQAAEAGYPRLFVRANINAVPLYERLGYRPVEPGVMPAGTEVLPVVFMAKD